MALLTEPRDPPGWADGRLGLDSPEHACGLAALWASRPVAWGAGGRDCISPRTGPGLCTTPLAPLPQAGAQALSFGAPHLVTIPTWVANSGGGVSHQGCSCSPGPLDPPPHLKPTFLEVLRSGAGGQKRPRFFWVENQECFGCF